MSEENLALAREYYEAFNVGVAAVRGRTESYMEVGGWNGEFEVQEYVDAGEDIVVISTLRGGSARFETGIVPMDVTVAQVFLFEGGVLRRFKSSLSRAEALEAVGLAE
jgi:hypothetical protein